VAETIVPITNDKMEQCIELYINVFNSEPWNETWTYQTAKERLTDLLHTPKFLGFLIFIMRRLGTSISLSSAH
jgi:aminoglycoside 6'-N-acetyltransferase I